MAYIKTGNRPGPVPLPDPLRKCEWCYSVMSRRRDEQGRLTEDMGHFLGRRYCSRECWSDAEAGVPRPERWKEAVLPHQGRYRARQLKPKGPCEWCGTPNGKDIHHIDHDPLNNEISNLARICRRCHYRHHNPVVECSVDWCDRPTRRNGLCDGHDQRRKRGMDMNKPFQQRKKAK